MKRKKVTNFGPRATETDARDGLHPSEGPTGRRRSSPLQPRELTATDETREVFLFFFYLETFSFPKHHTLERERSCRPSLTNSGHTAERAESSEQRPPLRNCHLD